MATLAFGAIGNAVGTSILPAVGGISGAALGQAAGAIAGRYVDQALFAASGQKRTSEGPRLNELDVTTSTEGRPIPRLYGRNRTSGEMIWATNFEEEIITRSSSSGGASGKGGISGGSTVTRTEYRYYANFAIALAEGPITRLGRVWANGNLINLSEYTYRLYKGSESQTPDSLIEAKEGAGFAPSYRGTAYIVFERLALAAFGNRIPQFNFEVFRQLDDFEQSIEAICLIPSAGEYVYEPDELTRDLGNGVTEPENTHTHQGGSDWAVSNDQLADEVPNLANISLFVSWFGDDLRAGNCEIRPAVDNRDKTIIGRNWTVAGQSRASARLISLDDGRAAYGGTPSDETIINAITDLKARGLNVTFTPFLLMDIPAVNSLEDPYTGNPYQPKYPWRGRITVDPAPGQPGSADKTAAATSQLGSFIGTASPADFSLDGAAVTYTGPNEWSWRRMILHYAHLCVAAGGVDSFVIGSELKNLTTIRDEVNSFPFVAALEALAGDVKTVLGPSTKVTYAADWSEYFGHQPADGTGDVYFHLDPLWASPHIDAVGIDNYWPLSDWRSGTSHLDAGQYHSPYDLDYLQANITGGEGFDWYYANLEEREDQQRTPITDGAGKPWVFRYKDIRSWWQNQHYNRPGGIEAASPTAWVPQSKPLWFMETGCPAVHLGSNQPNLFIDPKSSESGLPYFSNGSRDDYIQRRYISAIKNHYSPGGIGFAEANNPTSSHYSGRMVDPARIYIYTWDARAYPAFPANTEIWGDGDNWLRGHWLNGRTGSVSLSALIEQILADYDFAEYQPPELDGIIEGYTIDRLLSARDALQPLELAFFFDSFESEGRIKFRPRGQPNSAFSLSADDLTETAPDQPLYELTRRQETELPRVAKINFVDADHLYQPRTLEGRQTIGHSQRVASATLPLVMQAEKVQTLASKWVQESWAAREEGHFALPMSALKLEPADIITLEIEGREKPMRITEISEQVTRGIECLSIEPTLYEYAETATSLPENSLPEIYGPAEAFFLDLPLLRGNETEHAGYLAATQSPWPGEVAFYRASEEADYTLNETITAPVKHGRTINTLNAGPPARWDYGNLLQVEMTSGELSSASKLNVLSGGNLAAIRHDNGLWEVMQFLSATLVAERTYELHGLLRAGGGTEDAMATIASPGADFILLDEAIKPANMGLNDLGISYFWRYGPAPYAIGHPAYRTSEHGFNGRGLKPLSPVHLRGVKSGDDLLISWIRRTRIGGDGWNSAEVPLGETGERYRVEILDNGTVIRTEETSSPAFTYTGAEQSGDWGTPQTAYELRITQWSEIYGYGTPATRLIANT